jgi:hypothetical protein
MSGAPGSPSGDHPGPDGAAAGGRAVWADRLSRRALGRIALGLAVGALGGWIAYVLGVPLAWMLGALFLTMAAALAGMPVAVPLWLRSAFLILVGLFLGESFDGLTAAELARWPVSLAGAVLYVPVAGGAAYLFYRFAARQGVLTALCSGIPGGLSAVVVLSETLGGDGRAVALSQSFRVALVIFSAPLVAFGIMGYAPPAAGLLQARAAIGPADFAILLAASVAAALALARARVPIPTLMGPILASAALRMAGVVEGVLPHWLVEIALVVTGASIGCRFHGAQLRLFAVVAGATAAGTAILLAVTVAFAAGVAALTGLDFVAALLAYAPGGLAEMSLIAIAIEADPGFVAAHHLIRIAFILVSLPVVAAWVKHRLPAEEAGER